MKPVVRQKAVYKGSCPEFGDIEATAHKLHKEPDPSYVSACPFGCGDKHTMTLVEVS